MSSARPGSSSLVEVLDRILDKGVVIDVWARVSLVGIEILTVEARVVVASVDTFLHYAKEISKIEAAEAEVEDGGDLDNLQDIDIEQSESPNPEAQAE
ncbi:gas vesicle structural protein GvpA [Natronomonas salina]|uniref:gas vesicle protein GvpA n=1 Tax=Natronomonas salina TaxID=1710540 RepID=UPI0015B615AE|nr:gas vesicle structural protein GvpA [Natronomonas salina]QLD90571.1 gas vesicle structural protein GvpA [Natronomonas salina]